MLILEKPFKLSKLIQPAKLPHSAPNRGTVATLTGWGRTEHGYGGFDDLRYAHMKLMSDKSCWNYMLDHERGTTLCFHQDNRGGCAGDSGSGYFIKGTNVVIGIHVLSTRDPVTYCSTEWWDGATNVWHFRKWIESNMK